MGRKDVVGTQFPGKSKVAIGMYQARVEGPLLLLEFRSREEMNSALDTLSVHTDGLRSARFGHNFPATAVPEEHWLSRELTPGISYIVAYRKGDVSTMRHERAHARFSIDSEYHAQVLAYWQTLTTQQQTHITAFLQRLGYSEEAVIDEFQAYAATEKANFFGIRLDVDFAESTRELAARQVGLKLSRRKR